MAEKYGVFEMQKKQLDRRGLIKIRNFLELRKKNEVNLICK